MGVRFVLDERFFNRVFLWLISTIAACSCLYLVRDYDALFHLAAGRYIVENAQLPTQDPFSYTFHGSTWHNHSPLFQILMAGFDALFGFGGLSLLQAVFGGVLTLVPVLYASRRGGSIFVAGLLAVITVATYRGMISPRPHIAGWLLMQLSIILLIHTEQKDKTAALLLAIPLYLCWLGSHGSHPVFLVLLALFAVGALRQKRWTRASVLGGTLGLCILAALLLKPGTLVLATGHVSSDFLSRYTPEWQSIKMADAFGTWSGRSMLLLWILSLIGTFAQSGLVKTQDPALSRIKRAPVHHTLALLGLQVVALTSYRMAPLFLIGAAPLWLPVTSELLRGLGMKIETRLPGLVHTLQRPLAASALVLCLSLGWATTTLALMPTHRFGMGLDQSRFPVEAVDFMKKNQIGKRIYNAFNWGGYLMIERYPEAGVFVEGRSITLYPPEFLTAFAEAYNDFGIFEKLAAHYQVDSVLMPLRSRVTPRLIDYLEHHPKWREVYRDKKAILFVGP